MYIKEAATLLNALALPPQLRDTSTLAVYLGFPCFFAVVGMEIESSFFRLSANLTCISRI